MYTKNRIKKSSKYFLRRLLFKLVLKKTNVDTRVEIFVNKTKNNIFIIWTSFYFLLLAFVVYGIGFYLPSNLSKEFVGNLYLGDPHRIRTCNQLLKRQLLYH